MRTVKKLEQGTITLPVRRKVAAYARVSSGKDAMLQSLSAQVSYYSTLIQKRSDWEYAGVYADEAISGTKDMREEFQRLMMDCRAGKIDLVLTKSISRFARNTAFLLETVRELRALGVEVWFERENIKSMSGDGELMLSILASFAQEESRSASENCKWRIRKRFEQGEPVGFHNMYGFRIHKGEIAVDEEQASVIRMIFEDYISGMGTAKIAKKLNALQIPSYTGGTWHPTVIGALIKNEKLLGHCLLQKKYTVDYLTKRQAPNRGELPQYYAEQTHPAIVDQNTFDKAQKIMAERARYSAAAAGVKKKRYPFTGKVLCEQCGKNYKRKTAGGKHYWQCATFLSQGKSQCPAKQIPEETLIQISAEALDLDSFDENRFADLIQQVRVPQANHLIYVFQDGHEDERIWADRSRSESWTDEMRNKARQTAMKGREKK